MAVDTGTVVAAEGLDTTLDITGVTVASGEALLVVVHVRQTSAGQEEGSTVTWDFGGVDEAMTLGRRAKRNITRTTEEHWIINAPTAGSSKTVRIVLTGNPTDVRGVAVPINGQAATPFTHAGPTGGWATQASPRQESISSASGDLGIHSIQHGSSNAGLAVGSGETALDLDNLGSGENIPVGVSKKPGASPTLTMEFSWTGGDEAGCTVITNIQAAALEELGDAELKTEALLNYSQIATPNAPTAPMLEWLSTGVKVDWTDNTFGNKKHRIHRRPEGTTGWIAVATVDKGVTTHTDTTAVLLTEYDYRICALDCLEEVQEAACSGVVTAWVTTLSYNAEAIMNLRHGREYAAVVPALTFEALLNSGVAITRNAELGLDAEAILQVFGQFIAEEIGEVMMIAEALMQLGIAVDRSQAYEMIGEALLPNPAFVFNIPYALKAESQMQVEFFVCEGWEDLLGQTVTYTDLTAAMATWIQHQCSSTTVTWADLIRYDGEC